MSLANFSASLSMLPSNLRSSSSGPNSPISSCLPEESPNQMATDQTPSPTPKSKRASHQLNRWSRARTIRSGHRLDRPALRNKTNQISPSPSPPSTSSPPSPSASTLLGDISPSVSDAEQSDEDDGSVTVTAAEGKAIYMVSDGTGWTAEHSVNAALGQFEHCLIDRACAVNTHLFSGVEDTERLLEIIKQAAREGALLLYTLVDPSLAEAAKKACQLWGVPSTDILRPTTEAIAAHLGVAPSGIPRGVRRAPLTEEYFKRIEAIDFTIKQDDGALPHNLSRATIVLVGVSRTGKTPLSMYLAQKGYKVANVPVVMGVELPKKLFEIDQEKVFGLTINPVVLQTIRKARAKSLGLGNDVRSKYSEMEHVREELEHANKIFAQNPVWPVIEVTGKAIEETAAVVVRIYHDRKNKCFLPGISKRY